jgi:hypothetical protein
MKRIDFRILLGALLIFGSILGFLELQGILSDASAYFWATVFGIAALVFLYIFFTGRENWWAAIPGFTLAGLSAASFLPEGLGWDGLAFLGGIGLGFWAVYISGRERWWAIIPGGILVTLGIVSMLSEGYNLIETGGIFFMGLGLTFLLVAILANMRWAYIPSVALLLVGLLVDTQYASAIQYAWIAVLLIAGGLMIFQALRKK